MTEEESEGERQVFIAGGEGDFLCGRGVAGGFFPKEGGGVRRGAGCVGGVKNGGEGVFKIDVKHAGVSGGEKGAHLVEGVKEGIFPGGNRAGRERQGGGDGELADGGVVDGGGEVGGGNGIAGGEALEDAVGALDFAVAAGEDEGGGRVALLDGEGGLQGEAGTGIESPGGHHGQQGNAGGCAGRLEGRFKRCGGKSVQRTVVAQMRESIGPGG